jgi:hypothetical protein
MANRAGKRERQARNRKKRGYVMRLAPNGTEWLTLKARHRNPDPHKTAMEFEKLRGTMVAAPVDDRGKPVKNDV